MHMVAPVQRTGPVMLRSVQPREGPTGLPQHSEGDTGGFCGILQRILPLPQLTFSSASEEKKSAKHSDLGQHGRRNGSPQQLPPADTALPPLT